MLRKAYSKEDKEEERLRSKEKAHVEIFEDSSEASHVVAREIVDLVRISREQGRRCVLGLATGSTPSQIYRFLVKEHKEKRLSFKHVITFNLDEYYPMQPESLQSYHKFMWESLFSHIDILPENVHIPNGTVAQEDLDRHCEEYEAKIKELGPVDIQLLGLGRTGHIGFNESGSLRTSTTRMVYLNKTTRVDAAADFFAQEHVPKQAITMGLSTIMQAKRILLVAFGENKAKAVHQAVEEAPSENCAASFLQSHPNTTIFVDAAASNGLTRVQSPWILTDMQWTEKDIRKAVIWLSQQTGKALLKLVEDDYNAHNLQELVLGEKAADLNNKVFQHLMATITRAPGDRYSTRESSSLSMAASSSQKRRKVLIMSPHPDDDVISCGGTFIRLVETGCEVHVAYQTSGNVAVSDEEALRFAEFAASYSGVMEAVSPDSLPDVAETVRTQLRQKQPGEKDSKLVGDIKTLIRYSEAKSAARVAGADIKNLHFLDMPFYQTGLVTKKPLSREDIQIVVDLFQQLQPEQIYAAGDLSDPHGTHRTCLQAIVLALDEVKTEPWFKSTTVWLYRGAWQEFEPHEIEMAVPMTPEDLQHKIEAIFRHQSQKDRAMFPGADSREFWQRARDRNKALADAFCCLGLPEYEAMEAFVSYDPDKPSPFFSEHSV